MLFSYGGRVRLNYFARSPKKRLGYHKSFHLTPWSARIIHYFAADSIKHIMVYLFNISRNWPVEITVQTVTIFTHLAHKARMLGDMSCIVN